MTALRLDHRRVSFSTLALAQLALVVLAACAKKQDRPPRQVATVAVVRARRATVPYVIEASGVVTPLQSVVVTSQADGIITSVDFDEGQDVVAGQALFHVDPRPYQNAYEQAAAALSRDSATFANANIELERNKKLLAEKVVTAQELLALQTTASTSEATVRADRAAVATARFNLENTIIRAPIAGKTGSLLVKRGNLVHSGTGVPLVVINQVRPILVRFSIPSSQLPLILQYGARGGLPVSAVAGGVAPASPSIDSLASAVMQPALSDPSGQSGSLRGAAGGPNASGPTATAGGAGGGAGATLGSAVQQGGLFSDRVMGKLSFIDNAVDTTTGTVQLKAVFDNANGRLWAGQYATTSLHLYDEDSALVVPTQTVVSGQRGSYVYIVDQSDTARQRAVTVERTSGDITVIASGIHEGDRVVLDGQSRLTPDAPVRLRSAADGAVGGGGGGRRGRGGRGGRGGANAAAGQDKKPDGGQGAGSR
jgi:multidrug efflux system membrane fusion protein